MGLTKRVRRQRKRSKTRRISGGVNRHFHSKALADAYERKERESLGFNLNPRLTTYGRNQLYGHDYDAIAAAKTAAAAAADYSRILTTKASDAALSAAADKASAANTASAFAFARAADAASKASTDYKSSILYRKRQ